MAWPQTTDYFEAVQSPGSFSDPELQQGKVAEDNMGLPKACTGNFADVYQICGANKQNWAVKCFTREVPGLQQRYQLLSEHLRKSRFNFTVDFEYLKAGIRVHGQWYPILKMRWVEGFTLNTFVRDQIGKSTLRPLESLVQMWVKMARMLRNVDIAHGDLQHGNVLLVPVNNGRSVLVTLIDYDGMIVPTLANQPSGEVGHPAYQHPERLSKGVYNLGVDRFSHLVICCSLQCLAVAGKSLWQRFDNGDNLLFRKDDFADPGASPLFNELWQLPDPVVHTLVGNLILACKRPMSHVPAIDMLLGEANTIRQLSAEQQNEVEKILIPVATLAPVGRSNDEEEEFQPPPRPRKKPLWVYFIFGIYLLLLLAFLGLPALVLALSGDGGSFVVLLIPVSIIFLLGLSLMLIPIGHHWEVPVLQKSIILPLFGSATCAAVLFAGGAIASHEFFFGPKSDLRFDANPEQRRERAREEAVSQAAGFIVFLSVGIVWVAWICLFFFLSRMIDRLTWSDRIYQSLLGGSVLELLIAIPMHLVVRRRPVCCAGQATGIGIGVGIVVMLIALGPAVFFLFYRRYKDVYAGRRKKAQDAKVIVVDRRH